MNEFWIQEMNVQRCGVRPRARRSGHSTHSAHAPCKTHTTSTSTRLTNETKYQQVTSWTAHKYAAKNQRDDLQLEHCTTKGFETIVREGELANGCVGIDKENHVVGS